MALDMSRMRDTMGYYWGGVGAGRPARRGRRRRGVWRSVSVKVHRNYNEIVYSVGG
jgi:hypothetical protein